MSPNSFRQRDSVSRDEIEVHALYQYMLDGWNKRNADTFATSWYT